ncbi:hypothetical protein CAPTEDRAFT_205666 [Capitella teleta]|uniref:Uncharacterized protein n=1 Tax=Capitella teleta TaxID=283909 RepID=R7U736_CAPTE|nr:hypothetical protein CAPTEDRAFT_205666 [Capitella teleta]|eukprot:ELT98950.1 hypothetical protein CAPTEDRAFT_205666 [Capitella teleta]
MPFTTSSLKITPVTDGVVVQDRGIAHTQSGDVTVYVSIPYIDRDSLRTSISSIVDDAMRTLNTIAFLRNGSEIGEVTVQVLRKRLERVRVNSRRSKRGLFNIFGSIGKSLFGVATDEDLQALQKTVTEHQGQMTDFVTAHNRLIGVVNKMNSEILGLSDDLTKLVDQMRELKRDVAGAYSMFHVLDRTILLEGLITWLEDAEQEVLHAIAMQRRRIDHCQAVYTSVSFTVINTLSHRTTA